MTGALVQIRKRNVAIVLAALALCVIAWAWIDGGRENIHPIVSEAAVPLTQR